MTKLQDFLNSPIKDVSAIRGRAKVGDVFGIELECEGRNVNWNGAEAALLEQWTPHHDGSLRDHHGQSCEWVSNGPATYEVTIKRVHALFDYLAKRKAKFVCSNRTSTHIHFNMSDKNAYQLVNMFILFTILEGLMDNYCGEDRAGNLFCLSSRHAEQQLQWMEDSCFKHSVFHFREDQRYCSFNVASINKFGSVEFRGMRGLDNREDVLAWLSIIHQFTEFACYKMKNPVDLIQSISLAGPMAFLAQIFTKDNVQKLTKDLTEYDVNRSIYEGLRLVQMLCYRIGTEFDQVRLRGRDFWTTLKTDQKPELDVDPKDFEQGIPLMPPRPPRRRAGGGILQDAINDERERRRAGIFEQERQRAVIAEEQALRGFQNALDPVPDRVLPWPGEDLVVGGAARIREDAAVPEWWQPKIKKARGEEDNG